MRSKMVENDINANMFSRLDQIDCFNPQSVLIDNTSFSIPDFYNLNFGAQNSTKIRPKSEQTEHGKCPRQGQKNSENSQGDYYQLWADLFVQF